MKHFVYHLIGFMLFISSICLAQRPSSPSQKSNNSTSAILNYCIPAANCSSGHGFETFIFAGIDNSNSGCSDNGYGDFTSMSATMEIGQTYSCTILSNNYNQHMNMWIDFNKDNVFSEYERIVKSVNFGDTPHTFDISLPNYAQLGETRMRISAFRSPALADPCFHVATSNGEFEDYTINIIGTPAGPDAIAISFDFAHVVEAGNVIPIASIQNIGGNTTEIPVNCTVDGTGYSSTITSPVLGPGESTQIIFDTWVADIGEYSMTVTTQLNGDENPANNQISQNISVIDFVPQKRVVCEEGTGTWCGWCVRGIVGMEYMKMKYPDTWIGISVHLSDPMVNSEWLSHLGFILYPTAKIMRGDLIDPHRDTLEKRYIKEMLEVAPASLDISGVNYNESTRELSFDVSSTFIFNGSGYRFGAALIENNVTGSTSNYDQANYYSGGQYGEMGGFENLPDPVPAADMVYNEVGRALIGDFDGVSGSIPENVNAGESHSYTFNTTLNESWNIHNIEILAFLLDENNKIVNGAKNEVLVNLNEIYKDGLIVFPNPTTNIINIANADHGQLFIYNLNGALVKNITQIKENISIDISDLNSGIYFIKLINEKGTMTTKISIVK